MTKDYVSAYRRLLKKWTSGAKPRKLEFNGGNGLAPFSIEKLQRQADAAPEIQSEERVTISSDVASHHRIG
jgi:hypothetical protein